MKGEIEMLYPMYIRRIADRSFQAILPDFDSYFSNIDRRACLSAGFKESVEFYLRARFARDVVPSKPANWANDHRFRGGFWMLIELELDEDHSEWHPARPYMRPATDLKSRSPAEGLV
jgi:hypothetical protein